MLITANGQSGYINLYSKATKVFVYYVGAAAGTLTPQVGKRQGEEISVLLPSGDATITAETAFIVDGAGLLSFSASGVSGTIKVETEEA